MTPERESELRVLAGRGVGATGLAWNGVRDLLGALDAERAKVTALRGLAEAIEPLDGIMAAADGWEDIDLAKFGKVFSRVFIAYWAWKGDKQALAALEAS